MERYGNYLAELRLTGAEIQQLILSIADGSHGVPQVSGLKLRLRMRNGEPAIQRVKVTLADGSPLDESKIYVIATSDFLATGGGFSSIVRRPDQAKVLYDRPIFRDAVIEPLKRRAASGPLTPVTDGRLTIER